MTLSVKEAFSGDREAPHLTVGEGAARILASAQTLGGGNDWVGSRVGIGRHVEGRGVKVVVLWSSSDSEGAI